MQVYELHGIRVLACAPDGHKLRTDRDAVDLIAEALQRGAGWIVIPVGRLDEDFFRLNTRVAGEMIQKFVDYRRHVAIVGDISQYLNESSALRAFVSESNRGRDLWFLQDSRELDSRLASEV
jgi:hypothetical protein